MRADFRDVEIRRRIRAALDIELGVFWEVEGWHRMTWGWRLEAHYPIRWPTRHVVVGLHPEGNTWSIREPATGWESSTSRLDDTRGWPERLGRAIGKSILEVQP